mmetsp:Transcript_7676/g.11149  ORF Transcript_7676/g.11149 Transcript_7676/m.11149 type:complete len:313 (+) Transcript_7676:283-1221(+)
MTDQITNVLVLGATGKQGSWVCDALLAEKKFAVYGMTRSATSSGAKKLEGKGAHVVEGDMASQESIESAIKSTQSKYLYILTLVGTKESEIKAGKAAIDAAVACSIEFVVFTSVADADVCYDNVTHFKSKLEIENYLKTTTLNYSILRPVAFLDNFDDPVNYNPLTRGCVKSMWHGDVKVKMVSCRDTGKAAAQMFLHPEEYKGKTITCVSCDVTGEEVASALSTVSSEPCKYSMAMPFWVTRILFPDVARMVTYLEEKGYSCTDQDIAEFKKIVPDAQDPEAFFIMKGRWSNGEAFGSVPVASSSKSCSVM